MFLLSKTLDALLSPLSWAIVLVVVALFVERRKVRAGLLAGALLVLWIFSTEIVANALFRAVERPLLTSWKKDDVYDVVVVLGGLEDERVFEETGQHGYNDSVERLIAAFDLLRTQKARRALLSGGRARSAPGPTEAGLLRDKLVEWGIDPTRLLVEDASRNTWENATMSKAVLEKERPERVLLVTSAFHMKRSAAAFAKAGVVCDTLAVDVRSHPDEWHVGAFLPRSNFLFVSSIAIHEWFGRTLYRWQGKG